MKHKTAIIEKDVLIGVNTNIWAWVHIMPGARIGDGCNIGERVYIGRKVKIGNGCKIQTGAFIPEGVTLGDNIFIGPNVTFTNVKRPTAEGRGYFEPTHVEHNAVIGANATIICGLNIGAHAFVAAGAVVTRNVPFQAIAKGVPARCE